MELYYGKQLFNMTNQLKFFRYHLKEIICMLELNIYFSSLIIKESRNKELVNYGI